MEEDNFVTNQRMLVCESLDFSHHWSYHSLRLSSNFEECLLRFFLFAPKLNCYCFVDIVCVSSFVGSFFLLIQEKQLR